MMEELTTHKSDKVSFDIIYLDFQHSEPEMTVKPYCKTVTMGEVKLESDPKKIVAEFLEARIKESTKFPKFVKSDFDNVDEMKRRLQSRIQMYSYYIANDGRHGPANTIVMNKNTNDTYLDGNDVLDDMRVVINEHVADDTLFLLHNSKDAHNPGFKYFYHTDNDGKMFDSIVEVGWFPEKQTAKMIIY